MSKRVLCILGPGFEEIETLAPVDLLRRAGVEVVLAALGDSKLVTGRCGVTVQADAALAEVDPATFDLLLIPGGPGVKNLRADGRAAQLAKLFVQSGKPVGAICGAPTVLADAGLLEGKRFTAHSSVAGELPGALLEERVVEDGLIITSRGPGTALDFGLALVRRLCGEPAAREVAKAIMI
ncbi:MAG: DJ-1/PfpI family protein [Verrucomicrobiae bacterium]|nr:DJ-1/PfpI family protein [Verrucomicrobiae bacterium]